MAAGGGTAGTTAGLDDGTVSRGGFEVGSGEGGESGELGESGDMGESVASPLPRLERGAGRGFGGAPASPVGASFGTVGRDTFAAGSMPTPAADGAAVPGAGRLVFDLVSSSVPDDEQLSRSSMFQFAASSKPRPCEPLAGAAGAAGAAGGGGSAAFSSSLSLRVSSSRSSSSSIAQFVRLPFLWTRATRTAAAVCRRGTVAAVAALWPQAHAMVELVSPDCMAGKWGGRGGETCAGGGSACGCSSSLTPRAS